MLGRQVKITVEDTSAPTDELEKPAVLHSGTITEENALSAPKKGYAIGFPKGMKKGKGTVIAVVNKGIQEKYIVAPQGKVYYAPQLSTALSRLDGKKAHRLVCLYEKSCGAVVYRQEGRDLRFLLVKNKNGRHWGFPKGHMEKDETEQQTAIREVREETGLEIEICDGFRETSLYRPFGRIKKQVVFFVAKSKTHHVTLQKTEIDTFQWATLYEAMKLFRYENDLRVLTEAEKWILAQKSKKPHQ